MCALIECDKSIGLGVGKAIRARIHTRRRVSGVGLGVGKAIGARVGHTCALNRGNGGVGLGIGEVFGARVQHEAEVANAQG